MSNLNNTTENIAMTYSVSSKKIYALAFIVDAQIKKKNQSTTMIAKTDQYTQLYVYQMGSVKSG